MNVVDFDGVSVQQQIEIASHTDILIGVHGTAMQWAIVMPPRSVLVELQSPLHACTLPGINHPSRQFCEFGQTTLMMGMTHIVPPCVQPGSCVPRERRHVPLRYSLRSFEDAYHPCGSCVHAVDWQRNCVCTAVLVIIVSVALGCRLRSFKSH